MDQTREKLHCVVCGWDWHKRLGAKDPERCANPDCRSKRWKDGRRGRGPVADTGEPADHSHNVEGSDGGPLPGEPGGVLEAMRPAAERVVKRIADELQAEAEETRELKYEPFEEC